MGAKWPVSHQNDTLTDTARVAYRRNTAQTHSQIRVKRVRALIDVILREIISSYTTGDSIT